MFWWNFLPGTDFLVWINNSAIWAGSGPLKLISIVFTNLLPVYGTEICFLSAVKKGSPSLVELLVHFFSTSLPAGQMKMKQTFLYRSVQQSKLEDKNCSRQYNLYPVAEWSPLLKLNTANGNQNEQSVSQVLLYATKFSHHRRAFFLHYTTPKNEPTITLKCRVLKDLDLW